MNKVFEKKEILRSYLFSKQMLKNWNANNNPKNGVKPTDFTKRTELQAEKSSGIN